MNKKPIIITVIAVIIIIIGLVLLVKSPDTTSTETQNPTSAPVETTNPNATTTDATNSDKTFTMADIATHNSAASCYTTIRGSVYDLTTWIPQHPGGQAAIKGLCGKDGTSAFVNQHGGMEVQEAKLATFKIGVLAQ